MKNWYEEISTDVLIMTIEDFLWKYPTICIAGTLWEDENKKYYAFYHTDLFEEDKEEHEKYTWYWFNIREAIIDFINNTKDIKWINYTYLTNYTKRLDTDT